MPWKNLSGICFFCAASGWKSAANDKMDALWLIVYFKMDMLRIVLMIK